ncbi:MAG TPA: VOC family protein [Burkholderiales bacterium]|nr:VOC family protein [Burkholderiales bacterium]
MQVQPYLFFDGRCEEAIEYYRKALDAKVDMLMRYKESPEPPMPGTKVPGDKVMHAAFRIGDTQVLASDGFASGKPKFEGFSLSISARDDAHAKRLFGALADGGSVTQPLIKTFFASSFGMVTDKFGMHWMVIAAATAT